MVAIGDVVNIGQSSWLAKACTNSPSSSCHEIDSETPDDIGDVATAEDKGTTSWMAPAHDMHTHTIRLDILMLFFLSDAM